MLRTSSHALLSALAVVGLTALNGCTIYTVSSPPPRRAYAPPPPRPATTPTPAPTATQSPPPSGAPAITSQIAFGVGTGGAFRGLAYVIPTNSRSVPNLDSLVPFATVYTDSFDIAPQSFTAGFPGALRQTEWFAIRYEGWFNLPSAGATTFELVSQDGAIVYVDGNRVVNGDGIHGANKTTGAATLSAGLHQLRVDYFKGPQGTVALRLFYLQGSSSSPSLLVGTRR